MVSIAACSLTPAGVAKAFPTLAPAGELTPIRAGLSPSSVWRYASNDRTFAVRWSPIQEKSRSDLEELLDSLRLTRAAGIEFVPLPVAGLRGESTVAFGEGHLTALEWIPGEPLAASSESSAITCAVQALARLHLAWGKQARRVPFADTPAFKRRRVGLERVKNDPHAFAAPCGWESLERQVLTGAAPAMLALQRIGRTPTPVHRVHGDCRPEHFLMHGGRLRGVIDFWASAIDSPWSDLARIAGEVAAGDRLARERWAVAYAESVGLAPEHSMVEMLELVEALDFSGAVVAGANWLHGLQGGHPPSERVVARLAELESRLRRLNDSA